MRPRMAKSWIAVLNLLARYYVLVRPQIQALAFPTNKHSRFCRKILNEMVRAGLIGRTRKCISYNETQVGCPVFWLHPQGRELLAEATQDESYLLANVKQPFEHRLEHWIAISEIQIRMDAAIEQQVEPYAAMPTFLTEWNLYRPDASTTPEYFLHVQFPTADGNKMSCSPDGASILSAQNRFMAIYFEACRGSSSVGQVIGRKHRGYELLANTNMFRSRHFPNYQLSDFRVVVVTTNRWRRNQMARLMKDHKGWERWRFCTWEDFKPENILHEEFMIDCTRQPSSLMKPPPHYSLQGVDLGLPAGIVDLGSSNTAKLSMDDGPSSNGKVTTYGENNGLKRSGIDV